MPVEKIRSLFHANILYLEYKPETEEYGGDIYRKWADAVQHVEKEYSQIIADREFVIPTTIVSSISFLQKHLDYAMSDANYLMLNKYDNTNYYFNYWRKNQKSLSHDTPIERLEHANDVQAFPLMATHRSNGHKEVYSSFLEHGCRTIAFGEVYLELIDMISGKYNHDKSMIHIIRDISFVETKNGIKKSESSYSRYSVAKECPSDVIHSEIQCLENGIKTKLSSSNKNSDYSDRYSMQVYQFLVEYIDKRYYNSNFSVAHPFLSNIWRHLSKKQKYYILKIIPLQRANNAAVYQKRCPEINTILEIVVKTVKYYSHDKSVLDYFLKIQ